MVSVTKSEENCVSNLTFDRQRAGELSSAQRQALDAHLAGCVACRAKKARLDLQADAYLALPQSAATLQTLLAQRPSSSPWPTRALAGGLVLAAASALLVALPRDEPAAVRTKGGPELGFYLKRDQHVVRGKDGERVRAGDQLRFATHLAAPTYLSIFGIDSRGAVSLYYPLLDAPERLLPSADEVALAAAVELDDAPGQERIVAFFCDSAQPLAAIASALRQAQAPVMRHGCTVDVLHVVKEPRPP